MDLRAQARQIRLDLLAVETSHALASRDIPHAVIKGPTTSRWLYRPPREYSDLDILVPPSQLAPCVSTLVSEGIAHPPGGRLGEEASHSQVLTSPVGAEIDVHVTLPTLDPATGERVWNVLASDLVDFPLDTGAVPALVPASRCVVLAMHVLASGFQNERVREDLRRALEASGADVWTEAVSRAERLGIRADVCAAADFVSERALAAMSPAATLRLTGRSSSAIQLERVLRGGWPDGVRMLVQELFPSAGFMARYDPASRTSRAAMLAARLRRLRRIAAGLPSAGSELLRARRR